MCDVYAHAITNESYYSLKNVHSTHAKYTHFRITVEACKSGLVEDVKGTGTCFMVVYNAPVYTRLRYSI